MIERNELKRKLLLMRYLKQISITPKNKKDIKRVRITLVGFDYVGKSSLTHQFLTGNCLKHLNDDPTFEDFYLKDATLDGIPILFDILDTAGPEEYAPLRGQYHRISDGFILVASLDYLNSIKESGNFLNSIIRIKDLPINDMPIIFALNKVDLLENSQKLEKIDEFKTIIHSLIVEYKLLNTKIIVTSAKTGELNSLFEESERMTRYSNEEDLKLWKLAIEQDSNAIKVLKKERNQGGRECSSM